MRHVTCMNESCHMYEWVMSRVWMRHVTCTNEAWHTYQRDSWHLNETRHIFARVMEIYERAMSHKRKSHVAHMKESRHVCEWGMRNEEWTSVCVSDMLHNLTYAHTGSCRVSHMLHNLTIPSVWVGHTHNIWPTAQSNHSKCMSRSYVMFKRPEDARSEGARRDVECLSDEGARRVDVEWLSESCLFDTSSIWYVMFVTRWHVCKMSSVWYDIL